MDMVMKLGVESPVVIFTKSTCCIFHSLETLIRVFIGEEFVGGSNEIMSLNVRGKLKQVLLKANAIWI
ncbi:hypothetical protein H5410_028842 [Solanum commersonii]|uniref:Uncharacterized protein n=1 Tax=Solanum commersonii TaxID=4109 RepID=A0A9J5Z8S5_SOLCO|nr:hypothetical protein H5410_028842 [Solanum commersonii]